MLSAEAVKRILVLDMMKPKRTRSKIKPKRTALSHKKREQVTDSDPIFRLIQNSRSIPPSSFASRRDSSVLLSFARSIGKALVAWISGRRKKQNLYERLAKTVDEIASDAPELYEELGKPHRKKSRTSKID
jgi:hypothetical protein